MANSPTGKRKTFEIVQQLSFLPEGGVKRIKKTLDEDPVIKHYAYCVHDKDDVSPHIHINIRTTTSSTFGTIARKLGIEEQYVSKVKTFGASLVYMTHLDNDEKHTYSDDEVVANFDWQYERDKAFAKKKEFYSDKKVLHMLSNGLITLHDAYGMFPEEQLIRIGKNKLSFAAEIADRKKGYDCCQETLLIWGKAGVGKTVYAKYLAKEKHAGSLYMAGSSNDLFEFYEGQRVAILDDFRPHEMSFTDFLRLTDPYTQTPIRSRYHNKVPALDLLILTTTLPPDTFFRSFDGAFGEDIKQATRRIKKIIQLTDNKMIITEDGLIEEKPFNVNNYIK